MKALTALLVLSLFAGCGDSEDVNPVANATAVGVTQYPTPGVVFVTPTPIPGWGIR